MSRTAKPVSIRQWLAATIKPEWVALGLTMVAIIIWLTILSAAVNTAPGTASPDPNVAPNISRIDR